MRPAIVSGIVTGDAPASQFSSLFLLTVPDAFAKVYPAQFPSRFFPRDQVFPFTVVHCLLLLLKNK